MINLRIKCCHHTSKHVATELSNMFPHREFTSEIFGPVLHTNELVQFRRHPVNKQGGWPCSRSSSLYRYRSSPLASFVPSVCKKGCHPYFPFYEPPSCRPLEWTMVKLLDRISSRHIIVQTFSSLAWPSQRTPNRKCIWQYFVDDRIIQNMVLLLILRAQDGSPFATNGIVSFSRCVHWLLQAHLGHPWPALGNHLFHPSHRFQLQSDTLRPMVPVWRICMWCMLSHLLAPEPRRSMRPARFYL